MAKAGWNSAEIESYLQSAPSSVAGEPRPYADLIYELGVPGAIRLPLTTAFAEEIDRLISRLIASHEADDLELYKDSLLECDWGSDILSPIPDQYEAAGLANALRSAYNWDDAFEASRCFVADMLLCLFAALDAEHGSTYSGNFRPRPMFLLVAPKLNPIVNFDSPDWPVTAPRRNLVYLPVRRLLELSHALLEQALTNKWPNKPVGRKELGAALQLDDQHIGNLFDGTRKMSAGLFDTLWQKMCAAITSQAPPYSPTPLLLAALFWQSGTIALHPNKKLKSVIVLEEAYYTRLWTWHRERWASQLRQGGTVSWPDWLGT